MKMGPSFIFRISFPYLLTKACPYAIAGIATEITEIKRIHENLRESEERLNVALTSAHAGAWTWDIKNDIVIWDEYIYKLFGLKPSTFVGTMEGCFTIYSSRRPRLDRSRYENRARDR